MKVDGQQELVRYCLSGKRKHTSVRCDTLLWRNFRDRCKSEGLSTCSVLEKLILGWLVGVEHSRVPVVNVQVDMPRVVKRVRRRQLYFEDEVSVEGEIGESDVQPAVHCSFCMKEAVSYAVHEGGRKVFVCTYHREQLREYPKWQVIADKEN